MKKIKKIFVIFLAMFCIFGFCKDISFSYTQNLELKDVITMPADAFDTNFAVHGGKLYYFRSYNKKRDLDGDLVSFMEANMYQMDLKDKTSTWKLHLDLGGAYPVTLPQFEIYSDKNLYLYLHHGGATMGSDEVVPLTGKNIYKNMLKSSYMDFVMVNEDGEFLYKDMFMGGKGINVKNSQTGQMLPDTGDYNLISEKKTAGGSGINASKSTYKDGKVLLILQNGNPQTQVNSGDLYIRYRQKHKKANSKRRI